jgi:hypothetical protein
MDMDWLKRMIGQVPSTGRCCVHIVVKIYFCVKWVQGCCGNHNDSTEWVFCLKTFGGFAVFVLAHD